MFVLLCSWLGWSVGWIFLSQEASPSFKNQTAYRVPSGTGKLQTRRSIGQDLLVFNYIWNAGQLAPAITALYILAPIKTNLYFFINCRYDLRWSKSRCLLISAKTWMIIRFLRFIRKVKCYIVLPSFEIISRLTFSISSLITHLIRKICANIVKFNSF